MSEKFKFSKFFGLDDDDDDETESIQSERKTVANIDEHQPKSKLTTNGQPDKKIVSIQQRQNSKISIFEPRIYSDAKKIAGSLIENNAVIVNFSHADRNSITRIIDFLTGAVFTIDGNVERIGSRVFLFTPHKFEIGGDEKKDLSNRFR
ncbi:cell division protein SepF [Nicoliella lavandulae]|uniref:Cell division protein SepF n=1 Tax=Nicoliella lavandulae TaxID=3082954 RepID=A0ABU8SLZ9_9LACO